MGRAARLPVHKPVSMRGAILQGHQQQHAIVLPFPADLPGLHDTDGILLDGFGAVVGNISNAICEPLRCSKVASFCSSSDCCPAVSVPVRSVTRARNTGTDCSSCAAAGRASGAASNSSAADPPRNMRRTIVTTRSWRHLLRGRRCWRSGEVPRRHRSSRDGARRSRLRSPPQLAFTRMVEHLGHRGARERAHTWCCRPARRRCSACAPR